MTQPKLKAPFPYFGGKSTVATEVWKRFGNVRRYIEPFFGSGAVLLARPGEPPFGYEIINDYDGNVANFWRSAQLQPDEVARWCDWPCNHIDLHARRLKLIKEYEEMRRRLMEDDTWCNPKLAGYWCWCLSNWIGSGLMEVRKCDEEIIKRPQAPPAQHNSVKNGGGESAKCQFLPGIKGSQQQICQVPELVTNRGIMGGGNTSAESPKSIKPSPWSAGSAVTTTMRQLQDRLRAVKVI